MPNEQVASTAGLIWIFPLTFISSAFVPVASMPTWLQPIAQWNPISTMAHSCRDLFGNPVGLVGTSFPEQHPILMSLVWSALILAVFVPLAVRRYTRAQGR
jgi:ABC-type multidrug transport system permease subunit